MKLIACFSFVLVIFTFVDSRGYKPGDCEVCVAFLKKVLGRIEDSGLDSSDQNIIENELGKACDSTKDRKEEKFCYYIGASSISATRTVNDVTRPLSSSIPPERVCWDKLRKTDADICDLTYDKKIDLDTVDLNKLRVKELRRILADMGGSCQGCLEKTEFIGRIKELHGGAKSEL